MAPNLSAEPFDDLNKPNKLVGRSDSPNGNSDLRRASNEAHIEHSSRQGTVVIRATVEHIGLAGDTEMTVTVKWPASTFCVQPCAQSPAQGTPVAKPANVPPNGPAAKSFEPGTLYGDSNSDPNPAPFQAASQEAEQNNSEAAQGGDSGEPDETSEISPSPPTTPKKRGTPRKLAKRRSG
jgi:hypothetical protein